MKSYETAKWKREVAWFEGEKGETKSSNSTSCSMAKDKKQFTVRLESEKEN
jgi:hypothetical protein